jgi:hypothetical protein
MDAPAVAVGERVRNEVWNAAIQYNLVFIVEAMLDDPDPQLARLAESVTPPHGAPDAR